MTRSILTIEARHDLEAIYLHLQTYAKGPAQRIRTSLLIAIRGIKSHPYRGHIDVDVSAIFDREVRSVLVSSYRFFYLFAESEPVIIGVLHGARDFAAVLRRRVQ